MTKTENDNLKKELMSQLIMLYDQFETISNQNTMVIIREYINKIEMTLSELLYNE